MQVRFTVLARSEFLEQIAYYEARQSGLGACRAWGVRAKIVPSEDSFSPIYRPIAQPMGQKAGEKWTVADNLQPTLPKSDRLLGAQFRAAVERAAESVVQFPTHGKPVAEGCRRRLVYNFPFSLIYTETAEGVLVHAVAADRRPPEYWSSRLSNEPSH